LSREDGNGDKPNNNNNNNNAELDFASVQLGLIEDEAIRSQVKASRSLKKVLRQIDGDLQGHDNDNDWMKDLAYDEYLEVNPYLGERPDVEKVRHEVWMCDAGREEGGGGNKGGWKVLQKLELDEHEHGQSLSILELFEEETDEEVSPNCFALHTQKLTET